ncbi:hypothetical protein AB0878_32235 [Amycolatopsis sp. NPDC047767]|uniref:hypothetical protein n=1 Tax=Amycolatopsis sp. NPDC047767 TaxID=3156765 RepID=UPI003454E881
MFHDGRLAATVRPPGYPRRRDRGLSARFPVATPIGGGSSGARGKWRSSQLVDEWPLPAGSAVTVIFDWPARNTSERRASYDLEELRSAQRRVVDLFPAN